MSLRFLEKTHRQMRKPRKLRGPRRRCQKNREFYIKHGIAIDLAAAKTDADHALEESPPDATVQVRMNSGASARSAPALPPVAGYEII